MTSSMSTLNSTPHSLAAPAAPDGWLWDYLRDPQAFVEQLVSALRQWLGQWLAQWALVAGVALLAAVIVLLLVRAWWRRCHDHLLARNARLVTILAPPTVDPAGATAVWSNLVGLLRPAWLRLLSGQPHLVWEYLFTHEGVRIRVWVPGIIPPGMVERAVEAAWPGAHTRIEAATAPLPASSAEQRVEAVGGVLRLVRSEALPIRFDFDADPTRALLGAPVGLPPSQSAVVQILARPVTGHRARRARAAARRLRSGRSTHLAGRLLDLLTPGARARTTRGASTRRPYDHQTSLEYGAQDRAIVAKQTGAQYETQIRYAIAGTADRNADHTERKTLCAVLRGRAHAIASAFASYTQHNYYRRHRLYRPSDAVAARRLRRGDLLSIPELAALAHLPTDEAIPGLQRAGARAIPPPPGVETTGPLVKPIGLTDAGQTRPVGLRVDDARHHVHILGATGSGKSELMAQMILTDAQAGRGLVVIDPKGDLVTDLLMRLPEHLGDKVVLFDADSRSRPPCINPLESPGNPDGSGTSDGHRTVDNLVSIFARIYADSWGPRTDDILRAGLLTLTAQPGTPTLADLPKLLTVPAFRRRALDHLHNTTGDQVLAGFWSWYDELSDPARAHAVAPLMNKLRAFLLRPFVRQAIAAGPSTVDMDEVLNNGGICLLRIAKDALGAETASLLGSVVVARSWQAATRRARLPHSQRPDAGLYIDEAHNFLNLPYALEDMLAEARAYRLSMTLAHQYLGQLPRDLAEGISTNARTKVYFNASPEDAKHLARHTTPRLGDHDLSHLGAFQAAVRVVLHGEEAPAFTVTTQKLQPAVPGRARTIRHAARAHTTGGTQRRESTTAPPRRDGDPRRP